MSKYAWLLFSTYFKIDLFPHLISMVKKDFILQHSMEIIPLALQVLEVSGFLAATFQKWQLEAGLSHPGWDTSVGQLQKNRIPFVHPSAIPFRDKRGLWC